jgi:hypothetical protein
VRLFEFVCSQASAMNDCQFWISFVNANIILNATTWVIVEILRICFRFYPDMVWTRMPNEGSVAQIAIKNRQEKVFSLLCKMPTICKMQVMPLSILDNELENYASTSHMAATLASQVESIPGSAFQMQRELQWFKVCLI